MKKGITLLLFLMCLTVGKEVHAEEVSMTATAYCLHGTTATGTQTRIGVAASKPEHFGRVCLVFEDIGGEPGECLGVFVVEDTGGAPIRDGHVIDLWMETYDECIAFGKKKVIVRFI